MFAWLVVVVYVVIGLALLAGLIYVIIKRLEDREKEDFEKRDN